MNRLAMYYKLSILRQLLLLVCVPMILFMQTSEAAQLSLSDIPLFLKSSTKPVLMLNISKDHQLYFKAFDDFSDLDGNGSPETTYKHSFNYYGYFDSNKCYLYSTSNQQFEPSSVTSDKYCSGAWSGNFLNWASMTRIDTIRKILYGGLRSTDLASTIVTTTGTTAPVTTAPVTTPPITSTPVSTTPVTTAPSTTGPVVSSPNLVDTNTSSSTSLVSSCSASGPTTGATSSESVISSSTTSPSPSTPVDGTPTKSTPTSTAPTSTAPTTSSPATVVNGETTTTSSKTTYTTSFNTSYTTSFIRTFTTTYTKTDVKQYTQPTTTVTCVSVGGGKKNRTTSVTVKTYQKNYVSTVKTTTTATIKTTTTTTTTTTTSTTTKTVTAPNHGITVLERSYLPNDAHSFAKFYNGTDLTQLTPFTSSDVTNGITLCNTTESSTLLSQNVTDPPLIRVAKGNYSLWAGNERWQCRWSGDKAASNSNSSADSGINAASSNPSKTTNGLGLQDYVARVKVCDSNFIGSEKCKKYTDTTNSTTTLKPIGLLQTYGDDDKLRFGLMTGSYGKNKSGGVLRKNVSSITDEINVTTNGTFKLAPSTGGIIDTLNKLRIHGYRNDDGTYFGVTNSDDCIWALTSFADGRCSNWGNPQSEIFLESLRYLANNSALSDFLPTGSSQDSSYISGLTVATHTNPIIDAQWCAKLNVIQFNASSSSYDGDQLSKVSDIGATNMDSLTDIVGVGENIPGNNFFIGENGTDNNQLCTAKAVSNLSSVRGTCPDAPRLSGSYHIAGLAEYAHKNDIRSSLQGDQLVTAYGVALSPSIPKIVVPVPGSNSKTVTILPACRNSSLPGNCALVDFKIVHQDCSLLSPVPSGTRNCGKIYVNWEDSEQGGDFDQDEWGVLTYSVSSTQVDITTDVIAQSTPYKMGFGYVLSGTTKDGFHAHSGINSFAYTDPQGTTACSNCATADAASSVTYTIGSSSASSLQQPLFYAAKWGGFDDFDNSKTPNHLTEWDSDNNGIPDRYFFAIDPKNLETSLSKALDDVLKKSASSSAAAANSTSVQAGTVLYQAQFNSQSWSGHLYSFPVSSGGNVVDQNNDGKLDGIDANWDAATLIPDSRNIKTINAGGGVDFLWDNLSAAQQTALKTSSTGVLGDDTLGQNRLDWLRGDTSKEQRNIGSDGFRNRETIGSDTNLLGDIINSDPTFSYIENYGYKDLPSGATGQSTYTAFVAGKNSGGTARPPMVYDGANDGMLHAFRADTGDASSGKELFAYIPSGVFGNLSNLTEIDYVHKYFVDGTPSISDAYLSGWRTVLVGGLGKGGKTIYALDISNPEAFSNAHVLWEYSGSTFDTGSTGTTDADGMGLTYSQPQIARLNDGTNDGIWAVIFGNGYNSTSEKAFLYIVNLNTGALIKKIPTSTATSNGLSTPRLYDNNNDKMIDSVYAGDLQGNLWKFDLTATSPTGWGLGNGGSPLLVARNSSNQIQPITTQVRLGGHSLGGVMVYFGTGSYITNSDVADKTVQSFYAIWDKPSSTGTADRSILVQQTITSELTVNTGDFQNCVDDSSTPLINECNLSLDLRSTSENSVDYSSKQGWYLDLLSPSGITAGERVISRAVLQLDRVIFLTQIPSDDPCVPGGDSWLMELDATTGSAIAKSVFDFNNDDKFDDKDKLPSAKTASSIKSKVGMVKDIVWLDKQGTGTAVKELSGTTGNIQTVKNRGDDVITGGGSVHRLNWLQIQ